MVSLFRRSPATLAVPCVACWLIALAASAHATAGAQVEPTPAAVIQRHAIPSGTPTPTWTPTATPTPIPCDCDGNRIVSVAELILGVRLVLRGDSADACGGLDGNRDGALTVDELIVGVLHALYGCSMLAVPDAVFDANVFFGPARILFAPAAVREDVGGVLHVSIEYDVAQAISATGRLGADGALDFEGTRRDVGLGHSFTGTGRLQVIEDVFLLEGHLQERHGEPFDIRMSRTMQGTPQKWSGDYDVTLRRDGEESTLPLTVRAPASGLGQCAGDTARAFADAPNHFAAGPCRISPAGGFRFWTQLPSAVGTSQIVLFGLLADAGDGITGSGTWGEPEHGQMLGTWTAVKRGT